MPYYLYSKQRVSGIEENGIFFEANGGEDRVKFDYNGTLDRSFIGKIVLVGITTSGRVFDIKLT